MAAARWLPALGLVIASVLTPALPLRAQSGPPPIQATIFFKNPPPGQIPLFSASTPITIVVQVQNTSGSPITTTDGFSRTDFFRLLYFTLNHTGGPGPTIVNSNGAPLHQHIRVGQCLSRSGVTLQPHAIPVIPIETLAGPPTPFFIEYTIPDARTFYNLSEGGRYTVKAVIPFSSFSAAANTTITDCDNFPTPVLNISDGNPGRQDFTVISNSLDFRTCCLTFVGFLPPLAPEASCVTPCLTTNFGNTVPVKFQLFDTSGAVVKDAVAIISVTQISGTPPPQPPTDLGQGSQPTNTFKFSASSNQYVFNLDTSVLAVGVWQIKVSISDGSVHTAEIQLR
jgi:hypothetical protein